MYVAGSFCSDIFKLQASTSDFNIFQKFNYESLMKKIMAVLAHMHAANEFSLHEELQLWHLLTLLYLILILLEHFNF